MDDLDDMDALEKRAKRAVVLRLITRCRKAEAEAKDAWRRLGDQCCAHDKTLQKVKALEARVAELEAQGGEPVAFTCHNNVDALNKKREGYAGQPDYLVGYFKPTGDYDLPLYLRAPQVEPSSDLGVLRRIEERSRGLAYAYCTKMVFGDDLGAAAPSPEGEKE